VPHVQRAVEGQPCVQAAETIVLGGKQGVVPGRERFELGPADPAGGEGALVAAGFEFGRCQRDLGPGGGRFLGVQAGGLEGVLVVVEDRCGAVEGKAQHLAVRSGVVACHGRHVGIGVELETGVLHDLAHRHNRALAGHHGGGAHLEHLQDVRGVAGAESGDRCGHGFVVTALEGRHDAVILLAVVEVLGLVIDPLTQCATHGVPPLDVGLRLGAQGTEPPNGGCRCLQCKMTLHGVSWC